jgi:hypothetical protein
MKIFTLDEANALLARVIPKLATIRDSYARVDEMRAAARAAAGACEFGGGMEGGTRYVNSLYQIGMLTTEIGELGIQLKDYNRGLIDFPTMRGGRLVLFCWQFGDGDEIQWWHDTDAGFAGRQAL